MIGKGKSISHGVAALEYDLAKEINGQAVATEIARHELYGCTGAEMVQEMKPYHIDFPNVKNNCLRFEVSPSIEESATFTDVDWAELGNDFMQRMGLANHQYIIIRHSGTESKKEQAHLHILANRVSLSGELYRDNWIGKKATEAANAIAKERNFVQSQDIGKVNKAEIKEAMDGVLKKMQGFDFTKFKEELGKRGFKVREARASTGKLNGYYVTARSGTE
ncbi:relaxase/mobilization nuclease domain-containing protein, partial [Bacteroides thetaiotaomicron]